MSAHTPEPWYVVMSGGSPWIEAEGPTSIAHVMPIRGGEANAELIAAAPDLLAAMKAIMSKHGETMALGADNVRAALTAIAKAEGR